MTERTRFLIVDGSRFRRHSAPDFRYRGYLARDIRRPCPGSLSDLSVLHEQPSGSSSSLELDTSTYSREMTPTCPTPCSSQDVVRYQDLPDVVRTTSSPDPSSRCTAITSWSTWRTIVLGQTAAGCLAVVMSSSNAMLRQSRHGVTSGQNLVHYALLSFLWTTRLALRNDGRDIVEIVKLSGLRYLCLSIVHVQVNSLMLSALSYDTSLGNQVIDTTAAVLSLVIAYVILEMEFHLVHTFGFALTLMGSLTFSIVQSDAGTDSVTGDVLRILAGLCTAYNSMAQEIVVRATDQVEYLGMVGLIGSVVCGLQALAFERGSTYPTPMDFSCWFTIVAYTLAQVSLHSLAPKVLREVGATGYHLTMISSGFYSYFTERVLSGHGVWNLLPCSAVILGSSVFTTRKSSIGTQYWFPVRVVLPKAEDLGKL